MSIDVDQYRAYLTISGLADNTVRAYSAMAVRWCDWAITHRRDPYRPDPLSVRAWSRTVVGTRSSLAHARSAISWWCRACAVEDVSGSIPLPRPAANPRPLLDLDRTMRLIDTAGRSGIAGLAVLACLYTAGRTSEVASLAWANIDLRAGTVLLVRPKVRDRLELPLHPELAAVLQPRFEPEAVWVFPGRYGGHVAPAVIWGWVADVAGQAGVGKVTPRMLRRTALTRINDQTRDLRAAQLFAGHSRPETTALYTSVSQVRMLEACAALSWAG